MTQMSDEAFVKEARSRGFVRRNSPRRALNTLRRSPDLLVDVGVCSGTKWFYSLYPDTPFLLVDPKRNCEAELLHKPKHYSFVNKGLSDRAGRLELAEQSARSTFHTRTALTEWPTDDRYEVDVITFDTLIDDLGAPPGRIGLKIDVEGHELNVVRGILTHARAIEFAVIELSVLNRFEHMASFADIVGALSERGLRFYNFLNSSAPKPRRYYDCLFLQQDDPAFDGTEE